MVGKLAVGAAQAVHGRDAVMADLTQAASLSSDCLERFRNSNQAVETCFPDIELKQISILINIQ